MKIPDVCGPWINMRLEKGVEAWLATGEGLGSIGRKIAAEAEKRYGLKVDAENVYHRAKRIRNKKKVNQAASWKQAEEILAAITTYMMANCVDPSIIDENTKRDLLLHIETLKVFEADLRQGGQYEL